MHATVYQIDEENPIGIEDWITDEDLPEYFWHIADYAMLSGPKEALSKCRCTGERAGMHYDEKENMFVIDSELVYFRPHYDEFIKRAKELSEATLGDFVSEFKLTTPYILMKNAYDDEYGIYFYSDAYGLETINEFVRRGGRKAYIGAVLDYHY